MSTNAKHRALSVAEKNSHGFMNHPAMRNPPCPFLPVVEIRHDFTITRRHAEKGPAFYQDALRFAQSLWMHGKPAQAMLQLNKAWMADLAEREDVMIQCPPPYAALCYIMRTAAAGDCGFLGNPVRHFQHLATRVTGPRAEVRSWRAWVCFHLAAALLDPARFPRDAVQLSREGLWIPTRTRALRELETRGWPGEAKAARLVFRTHPMHEK